MAQGMPDGCVIRIIIVSRPWVMSNFPFCFLLCYYATFLIIKMSIFFLKTRTLAEIENSMGNRGNCFLTPNLAMLRKVCMSDDAPRVCKFNPVGQMLLLSIGATDK